jgi:hypothetical protein
MSEPGFTGLGDSQDYQKREAGKLGKKMSEPGFTGLRD